MDLSSVDWKRAGAVICEPSLVDEVRENAVKHRPNVEVIPISDMLAVDISRRRNRHLDIVTVFNDPSVYDERLKTQIADGLSTGEMFALTIENNAQKWIRHGIALLPAITRSHPITALEGSFKGCAGLVIGTGPSLEDLTPDMCRGRITVATNRSCAHLRELGIKPDIILGIDAHETSCATIPDEMLDDPDIAVIFGVHAQPSFVARIKSSPKALASQRIWSIGEMICDRLGLPDLQSGGSVATLAYSILAYMGCSEIGMIGVDCCLASDLSYGPIPSPVRDELICDTITYDGRTVQTLSTLDQYRKWFAIRRFVHPEIKKFVLSPKQAFIEGFAVGLPNGEPPSEKPANMLAKAGMIGPGKIREYLSFEIKELARAKEIHTDLGSALSAVVRQVGNLAKIDRNAPISSAPLVLTRAERRFAEELGAVVPMADYTARALEEIKNLTSLLLEAKDKINDRRG